MADEINNPFLPKVSIRDYQPDPEAVKEFEDSMANPVRVKGMRMQLPRVPGAPDLHYNDEE